MTGNELKLRYWDLIDNKLQKYLEHYPKLLLEVCGKYPTYIHMVLPSECRLWFSGNGHEEMLSSIIIEMVNQQLQQQQDDDSKKAKIRINPDNGTKTIILPKGHVLLKDGDEDNGLAQTPIMIAIASKMYPLKVNLEDDINALKAIIERDYGIPQDQQSIHVGHSTKPEPNKSLASYGVNAESGNDWMILRDWLISTSKWAVSFTSFSNSVGVDDQLYFWTRLCFLQIYNNNSMGQF